MRVFLYWRLTCSPKILIKAGVINHKQARWWHELLIKGLGEFFYKNQIDFTSKDFVAIKPVDLLLQKKSLAKVAGDKILIPVGGGKDSVVSLKILTDLHNGKTGAFLLNPTKESLKMVEITGVQEKIICEHFVDKKLKFMEEKGFLTGHFPYTAYLHFLSVLCAVVFGYKNVAFSNEKSSDEANTVYLGRKINHQYSKSFEFERKFRLYNQKYLSEVNVFSFLRPLYEFQIVKMFSKMPEYFSLVRSCNVMAAQDKSGWCGGCSKCLSIYILLYPFLDKKNLERIFSNDFFKNKNFLPLAKALAVLEGVKPFDCVATKKEVRLALYLCFLKEKRLSKISPFLKACLDHKVISKHYSSDTIAQVFRNYDNNNFLPSRDRKALKDLSLTL